jgi:hypothetical protein
MTTFEFHDWSCNLYSNRKVWENDFVLKYECFFHDFKWNNMLVGFNLFYSEKLWENDFVLGVNSRAFAFFCIWDWTHLIHYSCLVLGHSHLSHFRTNYEPESQKIEAHKEMSKKFTFFFNPLSFCKLWCKLLCEPNLQLPISKSGPF